MSDSEEQEGAWLAVEHRTNKSDLIYRVVRFVKVNQLRITNIGRGSKYQITILHANGAEETYTAPDGNGANIVLDCDTSVAFVFKLPVVFDKILSVT